MKDNKDSIFIISVAVLLCVFRYVVRNSAYLNEIMALFNLVALNYSVWCMFNEAEIELREKNNKSGIGKEILRRNIKKMKIIRCVTEIILFLVCGIIYFIYMKSATGNDILTIIALCFALEANHFSKKIALYCFKNT